MTVHLRVDVQSMLHAKISPACVTLQLKGRLPPEVQRRYERVLARIGNYVPSASRTQDGTSLEMELQLSEAALEQLPLLRTLHEDHKGLGTTTVPLEPKGPFWGVLLLIAFVVGGEDDDCVASAHTANLLETMQVADFFGSDSVVEYCNKQVCQFLGTLIGNSKKLYALEDVADHTATTVEKQAFLQAMEYIPHEALAHAFANHTTADVLYLPQQLVTAWVRVCLADEDSLTFADLAPPQWSTLACAASTAQLQATTLCVRSDVQSAGARSRPQAMVRPVLARAPPAAHPLRVAVPAGAHRESHAGPQSPYRVHEQNPSIPWNFTAWSIPGQQLLGSCRQLRSMTCACPVLEAEAPVLVNLLASSSWQLEVLALPNLQCWRTEKVQALVEELYSVLTCLRTLDLSGNQPSYQVQGRGRLVVVVNAQT